jgi:hypothetical protein
MTFSRTRSILAGMLVVCAVVPAVAGAQSTVGIGDQFNSGRPHPSTLSLWASDALVKLRWSHWGSRVATATGKVSFHEQGRYTFSPARAVASRIRVRGGRRVYTRLRYRAFGRWQQAHFDDCRFSA